MKTVNKVYEKNYRKFLKHVNCFGVHIDMCKDGTIEIRCFDRSHGGKNILLMKLPKPSKVEDADTSV